VGSIGDGVCNDFLHGMSKRTNNGDSSADRTETLVLEPPVAVASRLRKARLQKRLFGVELLAIKIDRFTLLERIGIGGMGEIYAAYDERLDRKVAIKLVRTDAAVSARAQTRLLREARALAKLSHPNVVQVYEAGLFEEQVFIAMEFVRGTTLRRWLEEHAATFTGRARTSAVLNQFLAIGRGLAAAHAAGVVHRDFKPDNVLVGDDGRPRVVDFGLARALLDELAETHPYSPHGTQAGAPEAPNAMDAPLLEKPMANTTHGRIVGTPRYMSPEQMRAEPADGRSDQFSFCVALYHALYGEWPFAGETLAALMLSLDSAEVAQPNRSAAVPAAVRKALLRGLARDPEQRFPNMETLLDALAGERPHMQRRMMVISGVALSAALGITIINMAPAPADPCEGVEAPINTLWNPHRREALESAFTRTGLSYAARTWSSTAARIDAYTDRWARSRRSACEAAQVRHEESAELFDKRMLCLDRGHRRLQALLDALDDIDARAVQHAANAVVELPDIALCENLEVLAADVAPPDARVAQAVRDTRDRVAKAQTESLLGHYREASMLGREALAHAEALQYDPLHAEALYAVGWVLVHHGTPGETREGEALMMRASNLAEGARDDELVASIWNHLALSSYQNHATTDPGHTWAQRALATVRRIGNPAYQSAQALRHLGLLHYKDDQFVQAERYQRQALDLLPADVSPSAHVPYLLSLANTLRALQRDDEALSLYQQALDEIVAEIGDGHPTAADVRFDLATFHAARGEFDRSVELMSAAMRVYESALGQNHPRVGLACLELANIERNRGALERALEHALRAKAIYEHAYAADDIAHAKVHEHLGAIAFRQGRYDEAVVSYRRTLDLQSKHLASGALDIGFTQLNLAEAHVQLGQYDEALAAADSAADILSDYRNETVHAFLDSQRGQAFLGKGRHAEAVTALEGAATRFGDGASAPAESAAAFWALAQALDAQGRDGERALSLARRARDLYATQGESTRTMSAAIERWLRRPH
jgi:serine/threonine protein kinase/tetratricopeptide (TPR) repeat protein